MAGIRHLRAIDQQPIIFGSGDKLTWLEAVAVHPMATDLDCRVAIALTNRVDKYTAVAVVSQTWIADELRRTDRAVRTSIGRLARYGFLTVATGGGRHKANEYMLLKPGTQLPGFGQKTRNIDAQNPEYRRTKPGIYVPPFPKTLLNSSANPEARFRVSIPEWSTVREKLVGRIGAEHVASWFDPIEVSIDSDVVTMVAKSRFAQQHIEATFSDVLNNLWSAALPTVTKVRIVKPLTAMRAAE